MEVELEGLIASQGEEEIVERSTATQGELLEAVIEENQMEELCLSRESACGRNHNPVFTEWKLINLTSDYELYSLSNIKVRQIIRFLT